jgi:hypothetical protein|tara:strand:+ start:580 stop:732 length:153 start_codon:yes stop_codon:yes gene_type:complete
MMDKIVAKIKAPFEKIGSVVFDRITKESSLVRTGVEVSAVVILIIVLAVL